MPAWPLLVLVRRIEQRDPEVLTRLEVNLTSEQVEDDQERSFRDLPRLLDLRAHLPNLPRHVAERDQPEGVQGERQPPWGSGSSRAAAGPQLPRR